MFWIFRGDRLGSGPERPGGLAPRKPARAPGARPPPLGRPAPTARRAGGGAAKNRRPGVRDPLSYYGLLGGYG